MKSNPRTCLILAIPTARSQLTRLHEPEHVHSHPDLRLTTTTRAQHTRHSRVVAQRVTDQIPHRAMTHSARLGTHRNDPYQRLPIPTGRAGGIFIVACEQHTRCHLTRRALQLRPANRYIKIPHRSHPRGHKQSTRDATHQNRAVSRSTGMPRIEQSNGAVVYADACADELAPEMSEARGAAMTGLAARSRSGQRRIGWRWLVGEDSEWQ
jgi:hypothetical protein